MELKSDPAAMGTGLTKMYGGYVQQTTRAMITRWTKTDCRADHSQCEVSHSCFHLFFSLSFLHADTITIFLWEGYVLVCIPRSHP